MNRYELVLGEWSIPLSHLLIVVLLVGTVGLGLKVVVLDAYLQSSLSQIQYQVYRYDRLESELRQLQTDFASEYQRLLGEPKIFVDSVSQLRIVLPDVSGIRRIVLYEPVLHRYWGMTVDNQRGMILSNYGRGLPIGLNVLPFYVRSGMVIRLTVESAHFELTWDLVVGSEPTI